MQTGLAASSRELRKENNSSRKIHQKKLYVVCIGLCIYKNKTTISTKSRNKRKYKGAIIYSRRLTTLSSVILVVGALIPSLVLMLHLDDDEPAESMR